MLRKSLLALAAVAALGASALSATEASAKWGKGFHGHWGHHHFYKPYWGFAKYGYGYDCYFVKKHTPWGVKLKKICY